MSRYGSDWLRFTMTGALFLGSLFVTADVTFATVKRTTLIPLLPLKVLQDISIAIIVSAIVSLICVGVSLLHPRTRSMLLSSNRSNRVRNIVGTALGLIAGELISLTSH